MPATVSHALSMTTPDDPAYENKPSNWNDTHAITLSISATEISGLFSNANNVSFGMSGTAITASIAAAPSPVTFSAGTQSSALGALEFANSNGVSFGLDAGTITATVKTDYLTSQSNQNVTADNGGFAFQTLSFSNVNGISFGTSAGSAITASHNALTSQSNQALSAANGVFTFQTANFSNANGVSFITSAGSAIAASVETSYAASNHSHGNPTLALTNLTGTTASASNGFTLSLSAANPGGGAQATISMWPASFSLGAQSLVSGTTGATGGSTQATAQLRFAPAHIENNLTFTNVIVPLSCQTVAGTGTATVGVFAGIYTLEAGTVMNLLKSYVFNMVMSQNNVTERSVSWWWGTNSAANTSSTGGNNSGSFTANRGLIMWTGADSLSAGQYWFALGQTAATAGSNLNSSNSMMGNAITSGMPQSAFGGAAFGANSWLLRFQGSVTTTTNTDGTGFPVLPSTINTSAISTAANNSIGPVFFFAGA